MNFRLWLQLPPVLHILLHLCTKFVSLIATSYGVPPAFLYRPHSPAGDMLLLRIPYVESKLPEHSAPFVRPG